MASAELIQTTSQSKTKLDDVLLLVPDGVGIRNFVLGPFLRQCDLGRCHILHDIPESLIDNYAETLDDVTWHSIIPSRDRPITTLLRRSLAFAQTYWVDNYPMRMLRKQSFRGSWRNRAVVSLACGIGYVAGTPRGIGMLDRLNSNISSKTPEVEHYAQLFKQLQPSVLFCSHQRPAKVLPPVLAARQLDIPTATFIFSWDNLRCKGRIAAPFDHFLVWSKLMKDELLEYYPDVTPDRVQIVGTPQFDPYGDTGIRWTKEQYCHRIGADPSRPIICYSGGDQGNSPEDPNHVATLMKLIRSGRVQGNPQVIVRPAPVDDGVRYQQVRNEYPELIFAQPQWMHDSTGIAGKTMPSYQDVEFLANTVYHSDLNINFGSTMAMDFAILDKPVISLAFDVSDPPVYGQPMWDYLQRFEHYRPVYELGAARVVRSEDEFATTVNAYLDDPSLDHEGRKRFVDLQVGVEVGQSSARVVDALRKIARTG